MKFQNDFKMISTCQIKMPQNATKCQDAKMPRCQDAKMPNQNTKLLSKYQIVIKIPNCYQNVTEFQIELCYFFSLICLRFIFIQTFHDYRIRCKLSELPGVQGCGRT